MYSFKKWDIIYCSKFPESIQCKNLSCGSFFTLPNKYNCSICGQETVITNIIAKPRPILLWIDKISWHNSMSFGIPLSASRVVDSKYNIKIDISQYVFIHEDQTKNQPMRAVIHQATRLDGCILSEQNLIGRLNDAVVMRRIEDSLVDWLF